MKATFACSSSLLALLLLCSACRAPIAFFQKEVPAPPKPPAALEELQRQAALYAADKSFQALTNLQTVSALAPSNAPARANLDAALTNITESLFAAEALKITLGPPAEPWSGNGAQLLQQSGARQRRYEAAREQFEDRVQAVAGKPIEGTGIEISWSMLIVGGFVISALLVIGLWIWSIVNPVVGMVAGKTFRLSANVASKAVRELVDGGQRFKDALRQSEIPTDIKELVLELFKESHMMSQSRDVQETVKVVKS